MSVTLSLVLVFGAVLCFLLRAKALGVTAAIVTALFGFYLAGTPAAAPVRHLVASVFTSLSQIH